jgi:Domain of unknown function (DUF1906)
VGARLRLSRRRGLARRIVKPLLPPALPLLALLCGYTGTASARTGPGAKVVTYRGYRVVVPAGWPVYDLAADPSVCVRFDRHAVYLGQPSGLQRCPAHAAGRTEAILEQPIGADAAGGGGAGVSPPSNVGAQTAGGSVARLVIPAHRLVVTATWGAGPGVVKRALGVGSIGVSTASVGAAPRRVALRPHAAGAAGGGAVYTGLGFDACSAPSAAHVSAWGSSPYRAVGVYIGGANMACAQPNLSAGWVRQVSAAGWHLIPTYIGLQAPSNSCGCAGINAANARAEGSAAAEDAIAHAQALGIGAGNPIYFDMETYPRGGGNTSAVTSFLSAWTARLHAEGYRSGVYSSANSGIQDLIARYGTGYPEPDDIWIADWNGARTASDPSVPTGDWASHERLHQYEGAHNETHGGVTINIDSNYLDGLTAEPNPSSSPDISPTPRLSVSPRSDGSIVLRASWAGATNVTDWQLFAGTAPEPLDPFGAAVTGTGAGTTIVLHSAFPYFQVQALDPTGQVVGSSAVVSTPPHLAIYGPGAYVSPGGIGAVPIGCFTGSNCEVATRIAVGRTLIASTGREWVPPDGGLVLFRLSPAGMRSLSQAPHRRLLVRITARDSSGTTAVSTLNLIPFATSGRGPQHRASDSPGLRIVGTTHFVSDGVVGGILAGCSGGAPCEVHTTIRAGGSVIASTNEGTLGANELGYLIFKLTPRGRALLAHATGNHLAAQVNITDGNALATATVSLVSFY